MPDRFVITGLPRSRTAWFAAYFTTGDVLCYHEAAYHKNDMGAQGYTDVGTAESGYVLAPDWVEGLGEHKLIVIHRPVDDVVVSLNALQDSRAHELSWMMVSMATQLRTLTGMHVEFDEINDKLPDIHKYLGLPYSQERADLFTNLNIQSQDWR